MTEPTFNATRQCCWCASDNRQGVVGYGGERSCPTCGWGGDGEPDVPCMAYKTWARAEPQKQKPTDSL